MAAKKAKGESLEGPNWLELPLDVTRNILERVCTIDKVTSVSHVCSLWWKIFNDPLMWRTIDMRNLRYSPYNLVKMCRYLVKLSCGHLEDIYIESFGNNGLLEYIANNTSRLQCISLINCDNISDEGFIKVANKFSLLEVLEMSYNCRITANSLEVIGLSCPRLKSLKYCDWEVNDDDFDLIDVDALVIAKTMPQLRHLSIVCNYISSDGLLAILEKCPLLEYLDLRECDYINWGGSLKKRCIEQIPDLVPPTEDFDEPFVKILKGSLNGRAYCDLRDRDEYDDSD